MKTTHPAEINTTDHWSRHRMNQKTKAPDTAICAQGLWNQQKGKSTILTRFRRVPLAREHPELCTEHKTSWKNKKWMQVVILRWLLPWRAALKPCWQEGRMFNSGFSCWSLDLSLPPTGSNFYQTTDPCHAHTFWTFWPSFPSPDHLQRMWTHPCVGMRCRSELLEISNFPGQLCESYKDWNWFQEKRFSSFSSCSFRTRTNPETHRVGRNSIDHPSS